MMKYFQRLEMGIRSLELFRYLLSPLSWSIKPTIDFPLSFKNTFS